jgi:hypothetical protein
VLTDAIGFEGVPASISSSGNFSVTSGASRAAGAELGRRSKESEGAEPAHNRDLVADIINKKLVNLTDKRIFVISATFHHRYSVDKIFR